MKKISLMLALCLVVSICAGCGSAPAETTAPPQSSQTTTAPAETTLATQPTETEPLVIPTEMPEPEVIDFALELPQGFEATVITDTITVFSSPNAPMDTSTITVEVLPMDESVLTMDKETFLGMFPLVEPTEATEVPETSEPEETADPSEPQETTEPEETAPAGPEDLILYSMTTMEIDGWPALYCDYTLVYNDYSSHIYRFEVVVNYKNYVFTFADNTDHNVWLDNYETCVGDIDLILDVEGIELDYSGLTHYELDCGMSLYAEAGMEPMKAEGFSGCLGSRNVIILMMADDKETNNLTDMKMEDYAALLRQTNELDSFRWDVYGNLATTFYSVDEAGMEYYNMICLKESEGAFWVCQMACAAEDQVKYARAFALWASSLSEI